MKLLRSLTTKFSLTFLLTLSACQPGSLCKKDLIAYLKKAENGLMQEIELEDDLWLSCSYRPQALLFDAKNEKEASKQLWFKLSIEYRGANAAAFLGLSKVLSEKAQASQTWFKAERGSSEATIQNVQAVSYLGTASKMDYLISLKKEDETEEGKDIQLHFTPEESLRFLNSSFTFSQQSINQLPTLKRDC